MLLKVLKHSAQKLMVFISDLIVVAESQVDQKLAKVFLGMQVAVWQLVKILKDNLRNNWALVGKLLL